MASEGLSWLRGLGLEECRGLEEFGVQGTGLASGCLKVSRNKRACTWLHIRSQSDAIGLQ